MTDHHHATNSSCYPACPAYSPGLGSTGHLDAYLADGEYSLSDPAYVAGLRAGAEVVERRMTEAAALLSTEAHHRVMRMAGSGHPCPVEGGCNLSAEEHHRLAYGVLAENKDLRRRVAALENGEGA